jgi:hypothetical protein
MKQTLVAPTQRRSHGPKCGGLVPLVRRRHVALMRVMPMEQLSAPKRSRTRCPRFNSPMSAMLVAHVPRFRAAPEHGAVARVGIQNDPCVLFCNKTFRRLRCARRHTRSPHVVDRGTAKPAQTAMESPCAPKVQSQCLHAPFKDGGARLFRCGKAPGWWQHPAINESGHAAPHVARNRQ